MLVLPVPASRATSLIVARRGDIGVADAAEGWAGVRLIVPALRG
jgi:hypothetical protein